MSGEIHVQEDEPLSTARRFSPKQHPRQPPKKKNYFSHGAGETAVSNASVTLVESLGPLCIWTFLFGFIALGGSISFLTFLWSSDGANFVWRQIAAAGWMPRCISLTSSILRIVISFQAAYATSILAAILLEGFRAQILAVPALSMMRWENPGPSSLVRLLWPNYTGNGPMTTCVMTLAINTLMSQILSTLLLTHVGQSAILSTYNTSNLPSDVDVNSVPYFYDQDGNVPSYWFLQPVVFPTIAEYHKQLPRQESGFYDTGPTIRGFLPISNQSQRSILYGFQGLSAVLNTRVICARPQLNFSVSPADNLFSEFPGFLQVTGTVGLENIPNAYYDYAAQSYEFACAAAYNQAAVLGQSEDFEWLLSSCLLLFVDEEPVLNKLYHRRYSTTPFLVFNISGGLESWYAVSAHPSWREQTLKDSADSEWKIFTSDAGNFTKGLGGAVMGVTLCFVPTGSRMMNISASAGVQHTEPRISWTPSNQTFNTECPPKSRSDRDE